QVESRVGDVDSVRGEPDVFGVSDFARVALFNRDQVARREVEVEGGDRGGDVTWDAVLFGEHRDGIGADLVRHVAVGGDAVGADHHAIDVAALHEMPGHVVGDQCDGYVVFVQFPCGQTRALQKRAGLVGV